jgi:hypothetical protein
VEPISWTNYCTKCDANAITNCDPERNSICCSILPSYDRPDDSTQPASIHCAKCISIDVSDTGTNIRSNYPTNATTND